MTKTLRKIMQSATAPVKRLDDNEVSEQASKIECELRLPENSFLNKILRGLFRAAYRDSAEADQPHTDNVERAREIVRTVVDDRYEILSNYEREYFRPYDVKAGQQFIIKYDRPAMTTALLCGEFLDTPKNIRNADFKELADACPSLLGQAKKIRDKAETYIENGLPASMRGFSVEALFCAEAETLHTIRELRQEMEIFSVRESINVFADRVLKPWAQLQDDMSSLGRAVASEAENVRLSLGARIQSKSRHAALIPMTADFE